MGAPAVDVAVFVGEEAPVTGLFEHEFDTAVPAGFDFDYVGPDALADVLRVEDGAVVADGATYRLLYLGGSSERMTLPTLLAIERLLDRGATVVGVRPEGSPSLGDDDACLRRRLRPDLERAARSGGRVIATRDLGAALDELGMRPALEVDGAPMRQIARVIDGRRLTFLANPSATRSSSASSCRRSGAAARRVGSGRAPHRAAAGRRRRRPTTIESPYRVSLPAVRFRVRARRRTSAGRPLASWTPFPLEGAWELHLPGRPVHRDAHRAAAVDRRRRRRAALLGQRRPTRLEFALTERQLEADRSSLDLGTVRDIARVIVNGVDCGVAWTPPFRVDVTAALRAGGNIVEVEVATPWRNRLIAEAGAPSGEVLAPMTAVFEPTARPLPAGLAGPVVAGRGVDAVAHGRRPDQRDYCPA